MQFQNKLKGNQAVSASAASSKNRIIEDNRPFTAAQRKPKEIIPGNSSPAVAQLFPYVRKNTRTNRTFKITHTGNEIQAIQTAGDPDDIHFGSLTYKIVRFRDQKIFELSHIISDPETGSGIGALLVYFMCEIAENEGYDIIEIPTAAPTAIGFYEYLGWHANNDEAVEKMTMRIAESDEGELLAGHFEHSARVAYNSDPLNHSSRVRSFMGAKKQLTWKDLKRSEQLKLIEMEKMKYNKSGEGKQQETQQMLFHNKAVANIGMKGKTSVIKNKALGSINKTWEDPVKALWDKVWESRNKPGYTSFPKHPDEE